MKKKWRSLLLLLFTVLVIGGALIWILEPRYAYIPPENEVVNNNQADFGIDYFGKFVKNGESIGEHGLLQTNNNRLLSEGIKVDEEMISLGREAFYEETFGNEIFLTDIMGIVNGPLTIGNMMKAIMKLKGGGTTNLQVELAEDITIGSQKYKKGQLIDTGIDVPKGSYSPLGMPVSFREGSLKVGVSCAACHATLDRETKNVVEGAPNNDLNNGLIMALATNSTAFFTHTQINSLKDYITDKDRNVLNTKNEQEALPDPKELEKAVDEMLAQWPKGNFDSTIDLKNNPAQIPDSFTKGDFPYGWSGFAIAGPFNGLTTFNSNVHAQNSDALSQAEVSNALLGIDKEVYLGTILQNAANTKYRYEANRNEKPSEFFLRVDPTPGAPGINQLVKPPTFPKVTLMAPDSLITGKPGFKVHEHNNGMSAWQNTLVPPKPNIKTSKSEYELGERVFREAGCISCHAGNSFTNNRIVSAKEIGTEPSRAAALKKTKKIFGPPLLYSFETDVPIQEGASIIEVPTEHIDKEQIELGWAHNTGGGYKTPSLLGLYWTAPYLHDGGVSVGKDIDRELGLPGTLRKGITPDPTNSLLALVDKNLRNKVITANKEGKLKNVHVTGQGHEFWVDSSAGFTKQEQEALVKYLLLLEMKE
jgi:archaellin